MDTAPASDEKHSAMVRKSQSLQQVDGVNMTADEKRRATRKLKDAKAIAELKDKIPDIDNIFEIHARIGNGTFSTVLLASLKCEKRLTKEKRRLFAIKHLIPTSHPSRIQKELECLIDIGGHDNVAGIELCLRRQDSVAFVMPYLPHDRFQDYFDKMEPYEVQNFLRNLLLALRRVHSFNVIHRDVKPSNFLYNRKSNRFMLVDFGLAQTVRPSSQPGPAVSSPAGGGGDSVINTNKRAPESPDTLASEPKRAKNNENSNIQTPTTPRTPGTPSHKPPMTLVASPFKMPLKQLNEIITPKSRYGGLQMYDSPLTRHVKSAVLGASLTSKLKQQQLKSTKTASPVAAQPPRSPIVQQTDGFGSSLSQSKYNTNRNQNSSSSAKCFCYGKNQVCNICLIKREVPASRAGTPGYRPPEVLLKFVDQTTAVDIWAVGVIFISILSAVYPFFKAPDDFVALAEIVTLFGDSTIRRTALALSRQLSMSHKCKPLDLRKICIRLRSRNSKPSRDAKETDTADNTTQCSNCQQTDRNCLCANSPYKTISDAMLASDKFPESAYDLLYKLLEINPHKRITAEEALKHPFFNVKLA